jgi:hypothetical protein
MKRLMLTLPLLLTACGAPPAPQLPAGPGVTVTADLTVSAPDGRRVLEVMAPWKSTDIHHAVVTLYPEAADAASLTAQTLNQADLAAKKKVVFSNLQHQTPYRIVVTAYATEGDADPIHDEDAAKSTVGFNVQTETAYTLPEGIKLTLRDKPFSGATNASGITVTDGGFGHTGVEGVSSSPK